MCKILSYDKEYDILAIHKGFASDEKFKANIDAGDLILDVSTKGRVRGIEIINATKFFKDFNITKETLKNILDAKFTASIKPTGIILSITFKAEEKEIPAKIAVPLEVPRRY